MIGSKYEAGHRPASRIEKTKGKLAPAIRKPAYGRPALEVRAVSGVILSRCFYALWFAQFYQLVDECQMRVAGVQKLAVGRIDLISVTFPSAP